MNYTLILKLQIKKLTLKLIYKIDYKDVGIHFNFKMQLNYLQSITEKKDENTRKAL